VKDRNFYSEIGKLGWLASKDKNYKRLKIIRQKYDENPKICKTCGSIISFEKHRNDFCSHKCAATFSNKNRHLIRNNGFCLYCGKETRKKKYVRKFCNKTCEFFYSVEYKIKHNIKIYPKTLRKYLILKRGVFCSRCKNTIWMGKNIPLELHHIDGNYLNDDLDNLELLCPNCHSITDTYKGKNKGKGRLFRNHPKSLYIT
jgi:5-methylcytosine-specific restriction endonuclease McrA